MNILEVQEYIRKHFNSNITVKELAELSNMSVRNFSRVFHKIYGVPPVKYMLNLRLSHACDLLRNPFLSVSDVAWTCGFQDSNYFTRQFKAFTGYSPTEYRKQNGYETGIPTFPNLYDLSFSLIAER